MELAICPLCEVRTADPDHQGFCSERCREAAPAVVRRMEAAMEQADSIADRRLRWADVRQTLLGLAGLAVVLAFGGWLSVGLWSAITTAGEESNAPSPVERPGSFGDAFAEACVEENGSAMAADCEVVGDVVDHMKKDLDRATNAN